MAAAETAEYSRINCAVFCGFCGTGSGRRSRATTCTHSDWSGANTRPFGSPWAGPHGRCPPLHGPSTDPLRGLYVEACRAVGGGSPSHPLRRGHEPARPRLARHVLLPRCPSARSARCVSVRANTDPAPAVRAGSTRISGLLDSWTGGGSPRVRSQSRSPTGLDPDCAVAGTGLPGLATSADRPAAPDLQVWRIGGLAGGSWRTDQGPSKRRPGVSGRRCVEYVEKFGRPLPPDRRTRRSAG